MRAIFTLFSLLAVTTNLAFGSPIPQCTSELCGTTPVVDTTNALASITNVGTRSTVDQEAEPVTNAERFKRGLPPSKPKLRRGSPIRRTQPSSVSTNHRGYLRVDRADGGGTLGYVSKSPFNGAQGGISTLDNAAIFDFTADSSHTSGPITGLASENANWANGYTSIALIQGRDNADSNLSSNSFQYLYFGAAADTAYGATPQTVGNSYTSATSMVRTAETEVWSWDASSNQITAQWINEDGSFPVMEYWTQSNALYFGSNPTDFTGRYPSPITMLNYYFVPI